MKYKFMLASLLGVVLFLPTTSEAAEVDVVEGMVNIDPILSYFEGRDLLDRDDDGRHFREYIFDGHVIKIFEQESILWLDGEAVPFEFDEVNGVRLPRSKYQSRVPRELSLPADFFVTHFGYELNEDELTFGEKIEETLPYLSEADLLELPKEVVYETDNKDTKEAPKSNQSDSNISVATPEAQDKERVPEDANPSLNSKPEPVVESKPKEDTTVNIKNDDKIEEPPAPIKNPVLLGEAKGQLDKGDFLIKNDPSKSENIKIQEQNFQIYFTSENEVKVIWLNSKEEKLVNTNKGMTQTLKFENSTGDFYNVTIEVIDSRNGGLSLDRLRYYVATVSPEIVIEATGSDIHIYFKSDVSGNKHSTFQAIDKQLLFLGIKRYRVERDDPSGWDIWFNLKDSDWS